MMPRSFLEMRRAIGSAALFVGLMSATAGAQSRVSASGFVPLDSNAAPPALAAPVTIHMSGASLRSVISELAQRANVTIVFDPALPGLGRIVTINADAVSVARVLMRLLDHAEIQAMVSPTGSVVLTPRVARELERSLVGGTIRQPSGPLGGVHVSLAGTRFEAPTDDAGRFNLGTVPPGDYTLTAVRMGYSPVRQSLHVSGPSAPIELSMAPIAVPVGAVIVTPGYFGVMQPGLATSQALTRQQIETVPQLGEDVYRAVGRLPGVATADMSAKFVVRGEPSDALQVTLDGLPLVEPFHLRDLGDALSIVDLAVLGGAELITGGTSSEYGDNLAGVFRLHTVEPRVDQARAAVGVSLTNFRGMAQGGFAGGNGSWLVSGRRGYLDLAFKLANVAESIYPQYDDVFGKVSYVFANGARLAVHGLHAGDNMRLTDSREPDLKSHYASDYVWTTLDARVGEHLREETVAWAGRLDWQRTGVQGIGATAPLRVSDVRGLHTLGFRQDWSVDLGRFAQLELGTELRHEDAHYDYSRLIRGQAVSDHAFVQTTDSADIALDPVGDRVALYVSQRVRPIDALTLEAGVRYERVSVTGDALASPRLNASWQPTRSTTVRGSWGDYAQSESVFGLQVEDGVRQFGAAERATQAVVGVDQSLGLGLSARVEAYDRDLTHLRPIYVNAGSSARTFPELEFDRVLVAPTRGRSRGIEFSVEREAGKRIDWSASYVLSSSKQQLGSVWVPRVSDQPKALHVDWSLHPASNAWRLTASEVWHSGWPYTPDVVSIDTIGKTPGTMFAHATWSTGALNSERVPAYQRLDVRWTRFIDTHSGRVSMFLEVYNLLNTKNLRDRYTYLNINSLNVSYHQGYRDQLPRIPSFGITWEF
jgi:hypothetical protein